VAGKDGWPDTLRELYGVFWRNTTGLNCQEKRLDGKTRAQGEEARGGCKCLIMALVTFFEMWSKYGV
jgi:hypothetical protein